MKQPAPKIVLTSALIILALAVMPGTVRAQTLTTLGGSPPTPGPNDISHFSSAGCHFLKQ